MRLATSVLRLKEGNLDQTTGRKKEIKQLQFKSPITLDNNLALQQFQHSIEKSDSPVGVDNL
jgi:hypothetical protein